MESKFTKGPWVMKKGDTNLLQWAAWVQDKDGEMIHVPFGTQSNSEKRANARLIAAAPDMYKLLSECAFELELHNNTVLSEEIHNLLVKIRG